jgi:hypothetical protein
VHQFQESNSVNVEITQDELMGDLIPIDEYRRRVARNYPRIHIGQYTSTDDTLSRHDRICTKHEQILELARNEKLRYLLKRYHEAQDEAKATAEDAASSLVTLCRARDNCTAQKRRMQYADMRRISISNILKKNVSRLVKNNPPSTQNEIGPVIVSSDVDSLKVFAESFKRCFTKQKT